MSGTIKERSTKSPGRSDTERGGDAQPCQTGWSELDRGAHDADVFSSTHFMSGMIIRPAGNTETTCSKRDDDCRFSTDIWGT